MAKNINNLDKSLKQSITPADIGAAAASHGTHLTIGTGSSNAAAGNHTHSNYATTTTTGSLSSLQTSNKSNLVAAINEVFQSGANAKQQLVDALVAYGVICSTSDSWETLINHVTPKNTSLFLIENNKLNSAYSFYGVSGTSGSSWKYDTANGLYTNNATSSNYEYVTTNQKINFSKLKSIKITAKCTSTEHASGYKIWTTSVVANALNNSNDVSQAVKQSDFVPVGNTYITRTFDVSSWTGEYYLGITRNSYGGHTFYIKDIELISESGGAGTLEDLLGDKGTVIDEELLLLDKGTEYNTDLSGGIWTAAGIALTSGTGLVITPQSGKYKSFTFRNKINLSNYTSLEITVQCPAGSTEVGFVIDDTSVLGGTYSSAYGNATTTRPRAISTDSSYAGGTETYIFDFAKLYDITGISFNRSLYVGFTFGYASGNYVITNIKFRNNKTVPNKMNIISAASLPDTGEENQLCAITSTTPNRFVIADNSADTEVSDNIVRIRTTENTMYTAYTYPMDNVFLNLRIAAVYQNKSAIPLWLFRNGEWIQIGFTSDFALKNKVVQSQFPLATDLSSYCRFSSSYGISVSGDSSSGMYTGMPFGNTIDFSRYKAIRIKGQWSGGSTYPTSSYPVAIGVFGMTSRHSTGYSSAYGFGPSEISSIYSGVKFNKYTIISKTSGGPTSGTFDYTFDINTTAICYFGITSSMITTTYVTDIEFILK